MNTDNETTCPSDGGPCTLKCHRGHPARPCDPPPKRAANDDAADKVAA